MITKSPFDFAGFTSFMDDLSRKQSTIQFWYQFLMKDFLAYIGLYIAIWYRMWNLRVGSLKLMAPIFQAFDRPIYQRLLSRHLQDITRLPDSILRHLQAGGFSVRLTATNWHAVALDECHKMCINKDAKLAIVRPSPQHMEHLSNYLPFRAKCLNNLKDQLFPSSISRQLSFHTGPPARTLLQQLMLIKC